MALRILLVFATSEEADIMNNFTGNSSGGRNYADISAEISLLITGVGGISTAWSMKKWLCSNKYPDLAINAGIAGSFSEKYSIGNVVIPLTDCFADMGIEMEDKYMTLSEAGLQAADEFPFEGGFIRSDNKYSARIAAFLPAVKAVTVNTLSGTKSTIEKIIDKYKPDIETMEGATFFYICAMEKIPFVALRAISNRIEPANRKNWNIPLALVNLADKLNEVLLMLE